MYLRGCHQMRIIAGQWKPRHRSRVSIAFAASLLLWPGGLRAGSHPDKHAKAKDAEQPGKPLTIPVEPLGFGIIPPHFVSPLASMFTVNFVDETHLLFTFTARTLLKRLPDATADDEDRNVAALLLELPSGKVIARTEWRTRDQDRYLWPLGDGRFLLRVRSRFSLLDPMRRLAEGGPDAAFRPETFLEIQRRIGYVSVSPGGDLLAIETLPPRAERKPGVSGDATALAAAMAGTSDAQKLEIVDLPKRPRVEISFFRLKAQDIGKGGGLFAQVAGNVASPALIELPATSEGYLEMKRDKSPGFWDFDFVSHPGKRQELAGYETSCAPRPYFISRSEFVAFGCRGSDDRPELSYFNLQGDEPWIAALSGPQVSPQIVAAPAAGRFALSRTLVNANAANEEALTVDDLTAQEITVFQSFSGQQLLKVQATPIERAGQNFDLSPAGTQFAVLRSGNLEIYRMPVLSVSDKKAVEAAKAMAPAQNDAPIKLNAVSVKVAAEEESSSSVAKPQTGVAAALPGSEGPQTAPVQTEGALGDQDGAGRQRPSLYGPNETPAKPQ